MIKNFIDKFLHRLLCIKWHRELNRHYSKVIKLNNIRGTNSKAEDEWMAKWRKFNIPISPL